MSVSILTNIAAGVAQRNLEAANDSATASIARLSSGNNVYRPSDDVSGLAVGTALNVVVQSLRAAYKNTNQGISLLNIADGGLGDIQKMLTRQDEIASTATSGALSDVIRGYLDQEFQALSQQIDLSASTLNFNGNKLIDGSLYNNVDLVTDTKYTTDQGSLSLTLTSIPDGGLFTINGVTFTGRYPGSLTTSAPANVFIIDNTTGGTAGLRNTLLNLQQTVSNYIENQQSVSGNFASLQDVSISVDLINPIITFNSNIQGVTGQMVTIGNSTDTAIFTGWNIQGTVADNTALAGSAKSLAVSAMPTGGLTGGNVTASGKITNEILQPFSQNQANTTINLGLLNNSIVTPTFTLPSTGVKSGVIGSKDVILTIANHGLINGNTLTPTAAETIDGLTVAATAHAITVIDQNHVLIQADSGTATVGNTPPAGNTTYSTAQQLNFNGSVVKFVTSPSTPPKANEIAMTSGGNNLSNSQIIQNLLTYLNSSTDANIASATYSLASDGVTLNITYKAQGAIGNNFHIGYTTATTSTGALGVANNYLANGASQGIDVSKIVNNADFVGKLTGFQGTYGGSANTANLSIKVGDYTYTATGINTYPTSNTSINFVSDYTENNFNGGSFRIDLAANKGQQVLSEADAQAFAARIEASFSGISFNQRRDISSYSGFGDVITNNLVTGRLDGTSFQITTNDYTEVEVESFDVVAPISGSTSATATITMVINGETYANTTIPNGLIQQGQILTLTSVTNSNNQVFFYNTTDITQDISTTSNAFDFALAVQNAFGLNQGKKTLNFQIGTTTQESIHLGIEAATTKNLYRDNLNQPVNVSIGTQKDAINAIPIVQNALNKVISIRASVGALQSRMNKAADSIQTGILNQDAARGIFLDTDMATESTNFANAQVLLQAGVSLLAQANQLPQILLKLLD